MASVFRLQEQRRFRPTGSLAVKTQIKERQSRLAMSPQPGRAEYRRCVLHPIDSSQRIDRLRIIPDITATLAERYHSLLPVAIDEMRQFLADQFGPLLDLEVADVEVVQAKDEIYDSIFRSLSTPSRVEELRRKKRRRREVVLLAFPQLAGETKLGFGGRRHLTVSRCDIEPN